MLLKKTNSGGTSGESFQSSPLHAWGKRCRETERRKGDDKGVGKGMVETSAKERERRRRRGEKERRR